MGKIIKYLFVIFILSFGFALLLNLIINHKLADNKGIISPLPEFLTLNKNNQVKLLDLFIPAFASETSIDMAKNDLSAKSVLVYDLSNDKTIFEKSADSRLPMASLTKIMTAVIALENRKNDDQYLVTDLDLVGEDSMGLSAGEIVSLDELLYGLMLSSGNDASEVIARNYPGGRTEFINAMNQKAKSMGLADTNFVNPSGLQGDGDQYSTAYDLLVVTKYALQNFQKFREVVSTAQYSIPKSPTHKAFELYNETNLLTTYEGVKGVKTGYTPEAGLCLISYLEYEDHNIIAIILNSEDRRAEMRTLLDFALKSYGLTPPIYKG